MNLFYNSYSVAESKSIITEGIVEFGYWQLEELMIKLGLPATIHVNEIVENIFHPRLFKRKQKFTLPSDKRNYFIFIIEGSAMIHNANGHCCALLTEGNILCNWQGKYNHFREGFKLEAYKDCYTLVANTKQMQTLIDENTLNKILLSLHNETASFFWKVYSFQRFKGRERLEKFLSEFPQMKDVFNNKDIADFVGIKQETFSRLNASSKGIMLGKPYNGAI